MKWLAFCGLSLIGIACFSGDSFPVPWPDELYYLLTAYSWYQDTSLHTPALHPERALFWYPPGYFILLGSLFKLTGYHFWVARLLSLALVIASLFCGVRALQRQGWHSPSMAVFCLTFLLPAVTATANFARPEPLLLWLTLAALWAAAADRLILAWALALLGLLVHLNALFGLAALGIYSAWVVWRAPAAWRQRTGCHLRVDVGLLALALLLLGVYLVFATNHLAGCGKTPCIACNSMIHG